MSTRDLAHISEDGLREQMVAEHLLGTAGLAADFGKAFGAEEEARLAGLLEQCRLHWGDIVDLAASVEAEIRKAEIFLQI